MTYLDTLYSDNTLYERNKRGKVWETAAALLRMNIPARVWLLRAGRLIRVYTEVCQ